MAKWKPNPRRRPWRLTADKRITAASKSIFALNAANAPLLKLPPELRNRIYKLVLCSNDLHVEKSGPVKVCSVTSGSCFVEVRESTFERGYFTGLKEIDKPCEAGSKYSLSLLRVSRQIYLDTVLLPFANNTFIVNPGVVDRFIWSLHTTQRKAIRSLEIRDENWKWHGPCWISSVLTKELVDLRTLKISIAKSRNAVLEIQRVLELLCNSRIQSLAVTSQCVKPPLPPPDTFFAEWSGFDDWATEMRAKHLSMDWSKARK